MTTRIEELIAAQDGVISRSQVLACGGDDNLIERQLRRRAWATVHRGVYVHHTGPLTWGQRAWAALLYYWPAALCHDSALRVHGVRTADRQLAESTDGRIHVAVEQRRRVAELQGDTTPARLLGAVERRPKLPRRRFLLSVLADVAEGAYSVLERHYLTRVERPHGLPTARRQRRVSVGCGAGYRDVEYTGHRLVVELDGRLGHELTEDRWQDMGRDLHGTVAGDRTVRIGWRQVVDACRTAAAVGQLLRAQGWTGTLRSCGPSCQVRGL